jgi:hypothetical protein
VVHSLSLTKISHVIALAIAPAFLLGCLATLMAMLISRLARIVDRAYALDVLEDNANGPAALKPLVPLLKHRARLIHYALGFAILSGVVTALLVVLAFVGALLDLQLETPVATLFIVGLLFFVLSLLALAYEVMIALGHLRNFGLD